MVRLGALVCAILLVCSSAFAFDDVHTGFILEADFGFGIGQINQSPKGDEIYGAISSLMKSSWYSAVKIGLCTSNRITVGLEWRGVLFGLKDGLAKDGNGHDKWVQPSLIGINLGKLFGRKGNSKLVSGTIGIGLWNRPSAINSEIGLGLGLAAGVGFELIPHWGLQLSLQHMKAEPSESEIDLETDATFVSLSAFHLRY